MTSGCPVDEVQTGTGDVFDMNTAEDLILFIDATGPTGFQSIEHGASRSIDSRQPQDLNRQAAVEPGLFTPQTAATAFLAR